MNEEKYKKTVKYFKENRTANTILKIIYKILPLAVFVSYPILLLWSIIFCKNEFLKLLLVPAFTFGIVTLLRIIINEPRPYEKYGIDSVFSKKTIGKSMPSRHTASAFIIAMAMLYVNSVLGIILLTISVFIMLSRVLAGVHYIRDVLVGAMISILIGTTFLFIL